MRCKYVGYEEEKCGGLDDICFSIFGKLVSPEGSYVSIANISIDAIGDPGRIVAAR